MQLYPNSIRQLLFNFVKVIRYTLISALRSVIEFIRGICQFLSRLIMIIEYFLARLCRRVHCLAYVKV